MRGHCSCAGIRSQRAYFRPSLSEIVCLLPPLVSPLPSPPPSSLSPIFYFLFNYYDSGFNPPDNVRTTALINALAEILWQAGGSKCAKLVLYVARREFFNIIILIVCLSFIYYFMFIYCYLVILRIRRGSRHTSWLTGPLHPSPLRLNSSKRSAQISPLSQV